MWCEMRSCRQSSACQCGDCERAELRRYHEGLTRERLESTGPEGVEKTGPGGRRRANATACSRPRLWTSWEADDREHDPGSAAHSQRAGESQVEKRKRG